MSVKKITAPAGFTPLNAKASRSPAGNLTGFTLIEILVVIVIIGILATLAIISVQSVRSRAKDARRISDIKQIRTALELYLNRVGSYPDNITIGTPLQADNDTLMVKIPANPDIAPYGDLCDGSNYSYSKIGSSYQIQWCLGSAAAGIAAGDCIATPDTMCSPLVISNFGTGSDGGPYTISSPTDLATADLNNDGCADGKIFTVTGLTVNSATVSPAPGPCLKNRDEILIINLQGTSTDYSYVGNYESILVQSVSNNIITFKTNLTKLYGNPNTQKIIIQRVPQYTDLTVNSSLSASAWNGSAGGFLAFRVSGTLNGSGIISMFAGGYNGGYDNWKVINCDYTQAGEGTWGRPARNAWGTSANGNGGGAGRSAYPYQYAYGSGGGGGGNAAGAVAGISGGGCPGGNPGGSAGSQTGLTDLSQLFMGGGGGGGGADDGGAAGDCGGQGGGIIMVGASAISGSLTIKANGEDARVHCQGSCNGGGGGAGGSIKIYANTVTASVINATYGNGSPAVVPSDCRGGGNGAPGRIAIYTCNGTYNVSSVSPVNPYTASGICN